MRECSEKFDRWCRSPFALSADQIEDIVARVPDQAIEDIRTVQDRIRTFAQHQKDSLRDFEVELSPGVHLGQRNIPVAAAGAYVPGGRYPLVASAHMTVVTAKVAGVTVPPAPRRSGGEIRCDGGGPAPSGADQSSCSRHPASLRCHRPPNIGKVAC